MGSRSPMVVCRSVLIPLTKKMLPGRRGVAGEVQEGGNVGRQGEGRGRQGGKCWDGVGWWWARYGQGMCDMVMRAAMPDMTHTSTRCLAPPRPRGSKL